MSGHLSLSPPSGKQPSKADPWQNPALLWSFHCPVLLHADVLSFLCLHVLLSGGSRSPGRSTGAPQFPSRAQHQPQDVGYKPSSWDAYDDEEEDHEDDQPEYDQPYDDSSYESDDSSYDFCQGSTQISRVVSYLAKFKALREKSPKLYWQYASYERYLETYLQSLRDLYGEPEDYYEWQ